MLNKIKYLILSLVFRISNFSSTIYVLQNSVKRLQTKTSVVANCHSLDAIGTMSLAALKFRQKMSAKEMGFPSKQKRFESDK